jgi:CelD/BcsL family acetyltransferase involved in cellulose biosynthesis
VPRAARRGSADTVLIIDPLTDPRWEVLRERADGGTVFHHPAWLRLLHAQYGYEITAWCLEGDHGRLAGGLPVALVQSRLTGTRLVALPFSDASPPLIDRAAGSGAATFGAALSRARDQAGLDLEVRGEVRGASGGHVVDAYVQHRLALERDVEAVRARFSKSQVKRGIAKARREGVAIERGTDIDALRRFYRLHQRTRRHQGMPTQPKRFILRFAELFRAGLGFTLIARHDGRDIAAAVFLVAGGTLTYKYGASDRRHLGLRPNNLLFMEAIHWGCANGARLLDFGRTDVGNAGLRAFKRAWGAEETPLRHTYFAARPPVIAPSRAHRALGHLIRRAPAPFSRFVGEALYRHVG